jgi:hypothetical protein
METHTKHLKTESTLPSKIFKMFDLYGLKFNLTVRGDKSYKTPFGGFVSMLIFSIFFAYAVFKAKVLFEKSDVKTITNTYQE